MSLNTQVIDVSFAGGVDTKTASKLVKNGFFLDLQNVVRVKSGALQKRYGFSSLSTSVFSNSSITSGQRLDTFNNDLLQISDSSIYSYAPTNDKWINRGPVTTALVSSSPIVRNGDKQAMPDAQTLNGVTVTVWEDSRGGVRATVLNDETQSPLQADVVVTATGSRPKVIVVQNNFIITYYDSTSFKCRVIAGSTPTVMNAEQTIEASTMTDNPYDVISTGSVGIFAYNGSSSVLRIGYITSNGIAGSPGTNGYPATTVLTERGRNAVNVIADTTNQLIYVFYHDTAGTSANLVRLAAVSMDFNTITYGSSGSYLRTRNITAGLKPDYTMCLFFEQTAASGNVKNTVVTSRAISFTGGAFVIGTETVKRSVGLASKAFIVNGVCYVTVVHESTLQSTYFTIQEGGLVVTRMLPSLAAGLTRDSANALKSGLPYVGQNADGDYTLPVRIKTKLLAETSTTLSAFVGLNKQSLTFNTSAYNSETLGSNFHIAGGYLLAYDGISPVEHGFHLAPEDVTAVAVGSGGSLAVGSYRVCAVYEWVDGQGQVHQSQPSIPVTVATGATDSLTVVVPTLRVTAKTGSRADVKVVVYRTTVNDVPVFYRDVTATNDPTADTVTLTCTQADTPMNAGQILYTVGGALGNDPSPACKVVHKHKNRLYLAGLEDPNTIIFSKTRTQGEGIAFSDGFVKSVDPRGGPVNCLSTLDDKVVLFKDTAIFTGVGEGPLDTGAQDDWSEPQMVAGDVGCSNQRSIVITPLGLMFQSNKGIYLLDRGLTTRYIGAPVESFNGCLITSAQVIYNANEVRFTTSDNVCLVYNYLFDQWSTFSNYAAQDACIFLGDYCHLTAQGVVNKEISGQYNDNGKKIAMRIETNWFHMSSIQGFQRIYFASLLGDFINHCYARISIATDFEPVYNQIVYFNTQTGLGTYTYGSDATYGSSSIYGGTGSQVFQFRTKPRKQKCSNIKLLIEDIDTSTAGGGSFSLVSLSFEVGGKKGIKRQGSNRTVGA